MPHSSGATIGFVASSPKWWVHSNLSIQVCPGFEHCSESLMSHLGWLKGKHIVFIGDSRTRYQYINLAYHVLHRSAPSFDLWVGSRELREAMRSPDHPVREPYPFRARAGSIDSKLNPQFDYLVRWGEYYWASAEVLASELGHDVCDCYRGARNFTDEDAEAAGGEKSRKTSFESIDVDNRFLVSHQLGTALSYFKWLGDASPFQGHWHPKMGGLPRLNCTPGRCDGPLSWVVDMQNRHEDPLITLLRDTILELRPAPTHIVFGATWPHIPLAVGRMAKVMDAANILLNNKTWHGPTPRFVWKSDIHPAPPHARNRAVPTSGTAHEHMKNAAMHNWTVINQYNITARFSADCYNDKLHLNEVGRTQLNTLLLQTLVEADAGLAPVDTRAQQSTPYSNPSCR